MTERVQLDDLPAGVIYILILWIYYILWQKGEVWSCRSCYCVCQVCVTHHGFENFILTLSVSHEYIAEVPPSCYPITRETRSIQLSFTVFTQSAVRPIQSIGCYVCLLSVCCLSPPGNLASQWTGDFWSKSVPLILAT